VALTTLALLCLRIWVVQPLVVRGQSMAPTLGDGEWILVDRLTLRFSLPRRGEIVVVRDPRQPANLLLKRVIGLPGETVVVEGGRVTIVSPHGRAATLDEPYVLRPGGDSFRLEVGNGECFVIGDNRGASLDSRHFGPIALAALEGRRLWW
jgi:signal peptidase I